MRGGGYGGFSMKIISMATGGEGEVDQGKSCLCGFMCGGARNASPTMGDLASGVLCFGPGAMDKKIGGSCLVEVGTNRETKSLEARKLIRCNKCETVVLVELGSDSNHVSLDLDYKVVVRGGGYGGFSVKIISMATGGEGEVDQGKSCPCGFRCEGARNASPMMGDLASEVLCFFDPGEMN
ncbi:hypothetical protein L6452_34326 [Arctium lappa]|uniref:Uncharacterized protein n=1 Tax=Arctium lappa TaxID=4217 RepID=A0ACB8YI52_ARCLA|nr:hypothetical protein L6452_34326 [Arctium lappa]